MAAILESSLVTPAPATVKTTSPAAWPAILAGAFVAVATSLILLVLGSGLGFAAVSPWENQGVSASTFTVTTAIWLIVTQWISAFLGGYISGRLRTTWTGTHTHEVFFRDTANGLVTWAVSTVFITAVVGSSLVSAVGGGVHAASDVVSGAAHGAVSGGMSLTSGSAYGIDRLFRQATTTPTGGSGGAQSGSAADSRAEAGRILTNAVATGSMPEADRNYLAQLASADAGITPDEAQKRVDELVSQAMSAEAKVREEADKAREAAAQAAIYTALSLLIGAFIASVAAAVGGRLRDEHP